jgi:hypothetical protein
VNASSSPRGGGPKASRWHGEQAIAFSRANAARVESTRASNLANAQTEIDVATLTQWVDAYARHETRLADFYRRRFRGEFQRLEVAAEAAAAEASRDIQQANDYVLAVVLFSAALFFGGISTRLQRPGPRAVLLGVGCAVLVGTLVWVATFPISISI